MSESDLLSDDEVILAEFIDESESALAATDPLFVQLERAPSNTETINAIFRPIHSLKANSAFLGLLKLKEIAHVLETMLDALRKKEVPVTREGIDLLLAGIDEMRSMVGRVKAKAPEVENLDRFRALVARIAGFRNPQPAAATPAAAELARGGAVAAKAPDSAAPAPAPDVAGAASLRVQAALLDALVARAGKAGEIADGLKQMLKAAPGTQADITRAIEELGLAMAGIRESIGRMHKAPLNELFQKVPRVVRTLCTECGKDVAVVLKGGEILVSRQILQGFDAPLIHMVRNSVDHGAEPPEDRRRAGKPAECRLLIQAFDLQGDLIVKISDDGRGIDFKALLLKALREGVIQPNQKVTPQEVTNLIFRSGLSTASKITDISGRGVGMDVVKRSIEQLGGTIEVQSVQGKGTDMIIRIPNP
jgi:two-component system chemotaxis sensor kinase CheA